MKKVRSLVIPMTHVITGLALWRLIQVYKPSDYDLAVSMFINSMLVALFDIVLFAYIERHWNYISENTSDQSSNRDELEVFYKTVAVLLAEFIVLVACAAIYTGDLIGTLSTIIWFAVNNLIILMFIGLFIWTVYGFYKAIYKGFGAGFNMIT